VPPPEKGLALVLPWWDSMVDRQEPPQAVKNREINTNKLRWDCTTETNCILVSCLSKMTLRDIKAIPMPKLNKLDYCQE